jgi:tetratricopeptide (TPR) repeat protein
MARLVSRFGISRLEADEHYRIALDFFQKNNLDQAILNMNIAIELLPNRAEYYAARGFFRLEDGDPNRAEPDFDKALQSNPYEVLANFGKGVIAYNHKDHDKALDAFMKAWAADNNRPETLYYLALTHHRKQDNRLAFYWMQQAVAQYQKSAENDREGRKRLRNAEKWLTEFEKLIKQVQAQSSENT